MLSPSEASGQRRHRRRFATPEAELHTRLRAIEHQRPDHASRAAIAELKTRVSRWASVVDGTIASFDTGFYAASELVPDDLFKRVEMLLSFVADQSTPPTYLDAMTQDLDDALTSTRDTWLSAQRTMAEEQAARAVARESAAVVQQLLVSLRRTLRSILGSNHRDYRKLVHRGRSSEQAALEDADDGLAATDATPESGEFDVANIEAA